MSSPKTNAHNASDAVQKIWLSQQDELERELFNGWTPEFSVPPHLMSPADSRPVQPKMTAPVPAQQPELSDSAKAKHADWLQEANSVAARERASLQLKLEADLTQKQQALQNELNRQRAVVTQELSLREKTWNEQRDKEWATLQHAKDIHEATVKRLRDEMAAQRVQEREELLTWKQRAEAELAETRRHHEHERLKQQQELARQIEIERERLRQERADFSRQLDVEREKLRHEHLEQVHAIDADREKLRHERAELERLRDVWREKFRREQVELQNGLKFFESHLSRNGDEFSTGSMERAASDLWPDSAVEARTRSVPSQQTTALTLEQIRERLSQMKQPELKKAA